MPDMNGYEVFRRLRDLDPQARVVFISGNPPDHRLAPTGAPLLQKPFGADDLLEALSSLQT
jgi:CheY-like chemotaxis protein